MSVTDRVMRPERPGGRSPSNRLGVGVACLGCIAGPQCARYAGGVNVDKATSDSVIMAMAVCTVTYVMPEISITPVICGAP